MTTEQKAMKIVAKYELKQGRRPHDVSKTKCGYDIKSGNRRIEVKGQKRQRAGWITIHNSIVRNLGRELAQYYVYVVYDIDRESKLKILDPDTIFKNLKIESHFLLTARAVNEHGKNIEIKNDK